jgi:hypothetical protein
MRPGGRNNDNSLKMFAFRLQTNRLFEPLNRFFLQKSERCAVFEGFGILNPGFRFLEPKNGRRYSPVFFAAAQKMQKPVTASNA